MTSPRKLTPHEFACQGSVSDPQISLDGRFVGFVHKSAGRSQIVLEDTDGEGKRSVYELPVKSAHPFGGGVIQLADDSTALYFVTRAGGISKIECSSGSVVSIYEGPGVSQIALSRDSGNIAGVVFGDRVALFDTSGSKDPVTLSERPRRPRTFLGLPEVSGTVDQRPDFVFDVALSSDGTQLAWHESSLPDMPWTNSRICYLRLDSDGKAESTISVCAGGEYFVSQPRFSSDGGTLGFLAETGSYLRLWTADLPAWTAELLVDENYEHGGATWGGGNRNFDFSSDGKKIYFSRNEAGHGRLVCLDLDTSAITDVGKAHHFGVKTSSRSLVALRSGAKTPNSIVRYDLETGGRVELAKAFSESFYSAPSVEPLVGTAHYSTLLHNFVKSSQREVVAAVEPSDVPYRIYRPEGVSGPLPTVATFHGGPTDQALVTYSSRNVAFLQAGFQVLNFDYRGSTGWGRSFREALDSNFGISEIVDFLTVLARLTELGLTTPGLIVANGGSSGGYSALRSICMTSGLLRAGIAAYPLIDLSETVVSTHRFESRYFDRLIGKLPDDVKTYASRSILASELDRVPLLVMHGDSDPVVNHSQVVRFVEEARQLGGDVEFMLFEGEGHGFSASETIEAEFSAYESFLGRIMTNLDVQPS